MNTIQAAWDEFRQNVLLNDMSGIELEQYKATFYAGAATLDRLFKNIANMECSMDGRKLAAMSTIEEIQQYFRAKNKWLDSIEKDGGNG